jgi:hypothetical protein
MNNNLSILDKVSYYIKINPNYCIDLVFNEDLPIYIKDQMILLPI